MHSVRRRRVTKKPGSGRPHEYGIYQYLFYKNEKQKMFIKKLLKFTLPKTILQATHRRGFENTLEKEYENLSTQQVFTKIYENEAWGKSDDLTQPFCSGRGSHDNDIVASYVENVKRFLIALDKKPNVIDLGCGDFFVGEKLREYCDGYIACDIVPSLISFNIKKYKHLNVDFRILDLTVDDLPKGDVVFIRQVFQHLSNAHVKNAISKIQVGYRYLVLTEHIPSQSGFEPNLDKPAGPGIRLSLGSGLVLTKHPFNLKTIDEHVLCEVPQYGGTIRTTVYTLAQDAH